MEAIIHPEEKQDRREFFRASLRLIALGGLRGLVGAICVGGQRSVADNACWGRGVCRGCGLLPGCQLPDASDFKRKGRETK